MFCLFRLLRINARRRALSDGVVEVAKSFHGGSHEALQLRGPKAYGKVEVVAGGEPKDLDATGER